MSPGILRLAEPRFLAPPRHRDLKFFLKTQAADLSNDADVDKLVELCFSRKQFPGLDSAFWMFQGIKAADDPALHDAIAGRIKASPDRSLGVICRAIIEEITRFSGAERACVKFPVDVEHIGELIEWFPGCKVIHITRDPRALAMSKSNDPFGTALRVLAHPRLAWFIRKGIVWHVTNEYRQTARVHALWQKSDSYRIFRYEDLMAQPEAVLRELCEFAGITFVPEMLAPEKGQHDHQPSSLTGKRQKAFDSSAAIRWKRVISPMDNWLISLFTRKSMRTLGYDPKSHLIFRNAQSPSGEDLRSAGVSG
jgi:hypothetical protein